MLTPHENFHPDQWPMSLALDVHSYLAEASPSLRVTDSWLCPISVAVAGNALGEVVKPGHTSVTLPPCDSGLAPTPKAKEAKVLVTFYRQF